MNKDLKFNGNAGRNDLTGEHLLGDLGQLILFMIFMMIWILDSFFFKYTTTFSEYVPLTLRGLMALIFLVGAFYFSRAGLRIIFGEIRQEPAVVRKGVFNVVRHPIYLGAVLFYTGLIITTLSLSATFIWVGIIGFYLFISRYEERLLINRFGLEYEKYMHEVPAWIPKFQLSR